MKQFVIQVPSDISAQPCFSHVVCISDPVYSKQWFARETTRQYDLFQA
jgi:hypothetical protein